MRIVPVTAFLLAACLTAGCALAQLTQGGGGKDKGDPGPAGAEGGAAAAGDGGVQGAGCGVDSLSGANLCIATSLCPNVVVDTQAFPHCGFRIRSGASELICGCGDSICSMGAFTTCAQAVALLKSQTEAAVCSQVGEDRCSRSAPTAGSSGTSGASGSGGNPNCDKTCLQECGSGAGCASICGCQ